MKWVRRAGAVLLLLLAVVGTVILFPQPLFAHSFAHRTFQVW